MKSKVTYHKPAQICPEPEGKPLANSFINNVNNTEETVE